MGNIENPQEFFANLSSKSNEEKPEEKKVEKPAETKTSESLITEDPATFFANLTKTPEQKAEGDDGGYSFKSAYKAIDDFLVPKRVGQAPTPDQSFLAHIQNKKATDLDKFDIDYINRLQPEERYSVLQARKDIPLSILSDSQQRELHEIEKSKGMFSMPKEKGFWYNLLDGYNEIAQSSFDILKIGAKVGVGAGEVAYRFADVAGGDDGAALEGEKLLSPEAKKEVDDWRVNAQNIADTLMSSDDPRQKDAYSSKKYLAKVLEKLTPEQQKKISEERAKKIADARSAGYSFMAPVFELPGDVYNVSKTIVAGGLGIADWSNEKIAAAISPEMEKKAKEISFANWKARRAVHAAHEAAVRENPNVYVRMYENPIVKAGLREIVLQNGPSVEETAKINGISEDAAKELLKKQAEKITDESLKEAEQKLPEENENIKLAASFLLPEGLGMGVFGGVGLATKATKNIVKGFKLLGKTEDEINAIMEADRALQRARTAERYAVRQEWGKDISRAGQKMEEIGQNFRPISEFVTKKTGEIGKITAPIAGAGIGYELDPEHPISGSLKGGLVGIGLKYAKETPTFTKEFGEAMRVSAPGTTFEALGKVPEGSAIKTKILANGGKGIDTLLANAKEYAQTGIHGGSLGLAVGLSSEDDPEVIKKMATDGLLYSVGTRGIQHVLGKFAIDPVIAERNRKIEDYKLYQEYKASTPETQKNMDDITDWNNVVQSYEGKLKEYQEDLNTAVQSGDKFQIERAQKNVDSLNSAVTNLKKANIQTRNELGRQFLKSYVAANELANSALLPGQNNVGFHILTTNEIFQKLRNDPANANVPDADIAKIAAQQGFYSGVGTAEHVPGAPITPGETGITFDRTKNSIVLNADALRDRMIKYHQTPIDALWHEIWHYLFKVPEFKKLMEGVEASMFSTEVKDLSGKVVASTAGVYSPKDLVDMYRKAYMQGHDAESIQSLAKLSGVWDESRGTLDEQKVANYMREEVMADLFGEAGQRHIASTMDGGKRSIIESAIVKTKQTILDKALARFRGLGGKGDVVRAANSGAEFSPEVMKAAKKALDAMRDLNGAISPAIESPSKPLISKAQMAKSKAIAGRYGMDSGLFETKMTASVFGADGNKIGESMPVSDVAFEGAYKSTPEGLKQLSGYGSLPKEVAGVNVPEGGKIVVGKEFVMSPDGKTPIMLSADKVKKAVKGRSNLIRSALAAHDDGSPTTFRAVSDDGLTFRGTFNPEQIKAIQDLPESIVPRSIKEHILNANESIAAADGTRWIMDYAAMMDDYGKYKAFAPKLYDFVPIGMHFSKEGNFLVTSINVGRIFQKMRLWNERMPGKLKMWDNNLEMAFDDFANIYLQNWKNGRPGETGLDKNPTIAAAKKNVFSDLLNVTKEQYNPDLSVMPKKKGDPRGKNLDNVMISIRVDHIAEMLKNEEATKLPVNYGFAKINFMPERMEGEIPRQEKRQIDENVKFANPPSEKSAIDALSSNKRQYFGMHRGLEDGYPVGIRIDIPAFTSKGVYVVTVHEKKKGGERGQVGERIGYDTIAKVDNPIFFSNEVGAKKIKSGEANKFPVATVEGQFNSSREIPEDINEWTPVGYNPREHSYFYDKTNDEPVLSGDEAISVGNTVFVKNPVYGDKANFAFMPERPVEERFPTPERGFYSGLQQTIDQKVQGKFASPDQLKAIISNPQNVKSEELKWSGVLSEIDRLAAENQGKVPKDKVMDYLRNEGAVKFEEVNLGGTTKTWTQSEIDALERQAQRTRNWDAYEQAVLEFEDQQLGSDANQTGNLTKYGQYQLPGGENYREIVLSMPEKYTPSYLISKLDGTGIIKTFDTAKEAEDFYNNLENKLEYEIQSFIQPKDRPFQSSHFPEVPNYVAHMRVNERADAEGNDGLFIEEFQSDRHQPAREKGYNEDLDVKRREELRNKQGNLTDAEMQELGELNSKQLGQGIPDAPFRKDWGVQLFKRALRDAVESGKSWIGWTTGIEQVNRYENDMRSKVDEITWQTINGNKSIRAMKGNNVFFGGAIDKDGNIRGSGTEADGKQVSDVFGKSIASKVSEDYKGSLAGNDLTVGGEGMKGFYDQILPKEIGKYVAKMGGKVEKSKIGFVKTLEDTTGMGQNKGYASAPIWKVNITPEMAGKVKGGQLQFMPERPAEQERIVSATYTDPRTGEFREGVNHKAANPNAPDEQTDRESRYYGFKTDTGRVVDREEAYRIAEESGQLKEAISEEDKFNADRGVLHSNMVEMEPTIGEKPQSSQMIGADTIKPADIETSAKPAIDAVIKPYSNALVSSAGLINFLPAYHGTPYDVDKFKLENIGTGEGAQAYGWGLYFAQAKGVAKNYRDALSGVKLLNAKGDVLVNLTSNPVTQKILKEAQSFWKNGETTLPSIISEITQKKLQAELWASSGSNVESNKEFISGSEEAIRLLQGGSSAKIDGNLYKVDLNVKDEDLLDWDKPLSEQSEKVQKALAKYAAKGDPILDELFASEITPDYLGVTEKSNGSQIYNTIASGDPKKASEALLAAGIPGIRYLDGMSRLNPKTLEEAKARVRIAQRDLDSNPSNAILSKILKDEQNRLATLEKEQQKNTYNYVVFDENLIKILDKNDKPVEGDLPKQAPLSGLQFMPQRPVGKTEPLPEDIAKGTGEFGILRQALQRVEAPIREPAKTPEIPKQQVEVKKEIPVVKTEADTEEEVADTELRSTGIEVPESVDEQSVISNAIKVANSQPWKKGRDFKMDLQRRVMEAAEKAGVTISDRTAEAIDYLARVGFKDALIALEQNPNAIGWYDEKTKQALGVMSLLFPEIATDENARFAFTWALAVTSNGLKVDKNFELAERVYRQYRKSGKMPTNIEAGQAQKAINEGLDLFNKLTKEWGMDNTRKFMQTDFTVGEISRLSKDLSPGGEFADTNVRGSAILGPKIGNGFFSNLYGLFDALTMDRWLVRTWGRWTGTLVELNPELTKQATDRLQDAVQKLTPEDKARMDKMIKQDISQISLEDLSVAIQKASMKPELRQLMNQTETGEEFRKSGNGLAKYLDGQKEAPSGPTERNFIREIFGLMLDELKSDPKYAGLTMADLQAVLWYAEKRLYETAKVKADQDNLDSSDADGYDDDEAPDYANAAIGVAREKGVSQKQIDEVLEKIKNDRTTITRPEAQEGSADQARQQEGAGGFTGKEKQKFQQYVAVTTARRNRTGNEKALWSYSRGGGKDSGDAGVLKPKSKKNLGVKYISEWKPGRKLATMFRNNGLPPVKFLELDSTDKASAQKFADTLQKIKDASVNGAAVYVYPVEDYQSMKLFLSESGQSGFALKPDGDIISVFSMDKGSGRSIMETAIAAGGKKLDAFDTILPEFYGTHGFVEAARIPWNDEFSPEGWDKETFKKFNNGEPDVVMMVLDPKFKGEYEPRADIYATDYDQAVEMQDSLLKKLNKGVKKK